MRRYEELIAGAVGAGETVTVSVRVGYNGSNSVPSWIAMSAKGDGGFSLFAAFPAVPGPL